MSAQNSLCKDQVCFKGPFDRLLGLPALQTAFRREKGDIGKEAEEKEKAYHSCLPVALFQNSTVPALSPSSRYLDLPVCHAWNAW